MINGEEVLQERVAGVPTRAIARRRGCSVEEINATLGAVSEPITPEYKVRAISVALEMLDAMQAVWFEKALAGDRNAGLLCLKIQERRESLLRCRSLMLSSCGLRPCQRCRGPPKSCRF